MYIIVYCDIIVNFLYSNNDDSEELNPMINIEEVEGQESQELEDLALSPACSVIPCAAHTLQLAVRDFPKSRDHQNTLMFARALSRKLRTPALTSVLIQ